MNRKVTLYTAEGLAEKLGLSYSRLRAILSKAEKETTIKDYRLMKSGTTWLAYDPEGMEIEIIDASPEVKEKNRKYRLPKK